MPVPWYLRSYQEKQTIIRTVRFYIFFFLSLLCLYQAFISFVFCPYRTESESMAPKIDIGDCFLIHPKHHWVHHKSHKKLPKRGEIVLLDLAPKNDMHSLHWATKLLEPLVRFFTLQRMSLVTYKEQNAGLSRRILKRIIGLPGDWIKIENATVYIKTKNSSHFVTEFEASNLIYEIREPVYENKEEIYDKKWKISTLFSPDFGNFQLAENEIFVLGDNRKQINDSRIFGTIPLSSIRGHVKVIYWPFKKIKEIEKKKSNFNSKKE